MLPHFIIHFHGIFHGESSMVSRDTLFKKTTISTSPLPRYVSLSSPHDSPCLVDPPRRAVLRGASLAPVVSRRALVEASAAKVRCGAIVYTGWWLSHPSEKYEFVTWDDKIPKIWDKMIQTTNQYSYRYHEPQLLTEVKNQLSYQEGVTLYGVCQIYL